MKLKHETGQQKTTTTTANYEQTSIHNVIFQKPLPLERLRVRVRGLDWGWAGVSGHFLSAPTVLPSTAGSVWGLMSLNLASDKSYFLSSISNVCVLVASESIMECYCGHNTCPHCNLPYL